MTCYVSSGFWDLPFDEQSSKLTTFITPFGRYRWLRIHFGITLAPEVSQKDLEQVFVGLRGRGVFNIQEDIIVFREGHTLRVAKENYDQQILELLRRFAEKEPCAKQRQT